tara:strand:- start:77 stop:268 length:192 start_codon:yes stop_codon:yes gene_type:complete
MYNLTEEEWECVRVCVNNAPIPYDITKKKIPADILAKIGQPTLKKEEGIPKVKYDLTQYGIID